MKQCWAFLDATSRSFAAVIKELEGELGRVVSHSRLRPLHPAPYSQLRVWHDESTAGGLGRDEGCAEADVVSTQVALFYLILRGLDTIEDDMTIPIAIKGPLLEAFHLKLEEDGWNFKECKSPIPWTKMGADSVRSGSQREGRAVARRLPGRYCRVQATGSQVCRRPAFTSGVVKLT